MKPCRKRRQYLWSKIFEEQLMYPHGNNAKAIQYATRFCKLFHFRLKSLENLEAHSHDVYFSMLAALSFLSWPNY